MLESYDVEVNGVKTTLKLTLDQARARGLVKDVKVEKKTATDDKKRVVSDK